MSHSNLSTDSLPRSDYNHSPVSDPLVHLLATALAAGSNSATINSSSDRHLYSNDPTRYYTSTTTTLTFEFFKIGEPSPFLPADGQSRAEAIRALAVGTWPIGIVQVPEHPDTRANSPAISAHSDNSYDSLEMLTPEECDAFNASRAANRTTFADNIDSVGSHNSPDESIAPDADPATLAGNTSTTATADSSDVATPFYNLGAVGFTPEASERWYAITRGRQVGVIQGAENVRPLIVGVRRGTVVRYANREAAQAAFDFAVLENAVEVITV